MNSFAALLLALIALVVGLVLGWIARGALSAETLSGENPAHSAGSRELESADAHQPGLSPAPASLEPQLAPIHATMSALSEHVSQMERRQAQAHAEFNSHLHTMLRTSARLSDHTSKLVTALQNPTVRGRWGEVQLERVVELAGMVKHVDFDTQTTTSANGSRVRPDMVIHLSGGRHIVVDAKAPYSAYLDALETTDPEEHAGYLRRHAHLLRSHVTALSSKEYQSAFQPTPEFVVLFVPADPFLDAALGADPELLEYAFSRDIVLATPSTLMALLRTVALGWQHYEVSEQAAAIQQVGDELYRRLGTMTEHFARMGASLEKSVDTYNAAMASLDSRVLVSARKLKETYGLGGSSRAVSAPHEIRTSPAPPRHAAQQDYPRAQGLRGTNSGLTD
ncbi:DNA recombination protein RmuC [Corynebacterium ciconiae DSM 44920]|uniref:DNA recombination protein RmuC n=1 Tax=Corynebacterium ciconiae TaxID=227319 RepID=UPI00036064AF|nr:DNA recombination protein RmuC [Corynebacterium ciconiae]WKD61516.1 DNA recombination protein RmuC [Corynebacterium ciconiae DSM 44920]